MPQFAPGESKVAKVTMRNPIEKAFDYEGVILMGVQLTEMSRVAFHLDAGEEKVVNFPVTMPTQAGVYPVYLSVYAADKLTLLAHYQSTEDVEITFPLKVNVVSLGGILTSSPRLGVEYRWSSVELFYVDGEALASNYTYLATLLSPGSMYLIRFFDDPPSGEAVFNWGQMVNSLGSYATIYHNYYLAKGDPVSYAIGYVWLVFSNPLQALRVLTNYAAHTWCGIAAYQGGAVSAGLFTVSAPFTTYSVGSIQLKMTNYGLTIPPPYFRVRADFYPDGYSKVGDSYAIAPQSLPNRFSNLQAMPPFFSQFWPMIAVGSTLTMELGPEWQPEIKPGTALWNVRLTITGYSEAQYVAFEYYYWIKGVWKLL